jgi:hypothetical protein
MGHNREPHDDTDKDISWRTRELGPQMRKKLFEKVVPSGGRSGSPSDKPWPPPAGKDQKQSEKSRPDK